MHSTKILSFTATRYNNFHVTGNAYIDDDLSNSTMLDLYNTPNPFRTSTVISYSSPSNIYEATIEIYNIKGKLVRKLHICAYSLSRFLEVVWDCKDDKGKDVGPEI